MNYETALHHYAETVQVYSPDGKRILNLLDDKINLYASQNDLERRDFWKEVKGTFVRKEEYVEMERLRQLEVYHRNLEVLFSLGKATTSVTKTYEWIKLMPKLEEYVNATLDYVIERQDAYKSLSDDHRQASSDSLRFFHSIMKTSGTSDKVKFSYLPLTIWAVENLFIYNKYSQDFNGYLLLTLIPLLRKHRIAANKFAELIGVEDYNKDFANTASNVFITPKQYQLSEDFDDDEDVSVDFFTNSLKYALENNDGRKLDIQAAISERRQNPLFCLYRSHKVAEALMCDDEFEYIVSPKVANNINKQFDIQIQTYSVRNIEFIVLTLARELLSQPVGSIQRNIAVWEKTEETVLNAMNTLLEAQILPVKSGIYIQNFLREGKRRIEENVE